MSARAVRYEGWACGNCGHRFVLRTKICDDGSYDDDLSRSVAELCCVCVICKQVLAADVGRRSPPGLRRCEACEAKQAAEDSARSHTEFLKREAVPFDDGAFADDTFYGSEDEILEQAVGLLKDDGVDNPTKEQVRALLDEWELVPTAPGKFYAFDVDDFLHDRAPEWWASSDHPDLVAAAAKLNEALRDATTEWRVPDWNKRIDLDSIMGCWVPT